MRAQISRHRLALGVVFLGLASFGVFWSKGGSLSQATANPPALLGKTQSDTATPPASTMPPSDYSRRVVAYIYDTIPITREELGEYLIARLGAERLNNLVNLRIIEHVCKQKGIEVTAAEVDAEFNETIKSLGPTVTAKDFEAKVLKPRNKTLYEWKEDALRPELLMRKLCRERVHATDEDLQQAFDAEFGEKVLCRIILWPRSEQRVALSMYGKIRDSQEEFERASRTQASPSLAATGGEIKPIAHNTTGNPALEKAAFSLRPGELSQVIETPEGYVVIKCIRRDPPDPSKKLETYRDKLTKEVLDQKLKFEIQKYFVQLRTQAVPKVILKQAITEEELIRDAQREMKSESPASNFPQGH